MGNTASSDAAAREPLTSGADKTPLPSALVIVGPSGVGKGTLINRLKEGSDKFGFSCSHTTRKPREGEKDGVHYHFTDRETFEKEISEGKFLEYAYVHNNIYGTSIAAVQAVASDGKCCILDIDVQGARQVRASGLPAIFVFIAPPSLDELERRLRGRGTETEEQITTRLRNAREEMASLEEPGLYDHTVVNNDLETCLVELRKVAARAVAGETGPPASPNAARAALDPAPSLREPPSATVSLRGWLGETGSPLGAGDGGPGGAAAGADAATLLSAGLARWRGRVALVTGASGPVGWAVTVALAAAGVRVVALSRRKAQLEALQEAVAAAGVPLSDFLPVVCDITKEAEVTALPRIVARRWPGAGIDALISAVGAGGAAAAGSTVTSPAAAAVSGKKASKNAAAAAEAAAEGDSSLLTGSSSAWVDAVSASVLGTALVCREAVSDMRRRGEGGQVVIITCAAGETGVGGGEGSSSGPRGMPAVAAAAVRALAAELRAEAAAGETAVRVSCLAAGPVAGAEAPGAAALTAHDVMAAVAFCMSAPPHVDVGELTVMPAALPPAVTPPSATATRTGSV